MTNYNDGNWHGWNGGECPVHPETVVEVVVRDPELPLFQTGIADSFIWEHPEGYGNIIAFRVVKEHREPREFWLHDGISFPTFEDAIKYKYDVPVGNDPVIHVREVLE